MDIADLISYCFLTPVLKETVYLRLQGMVHFYNHSLENLYLETNKCTNTTKHNNENNNKHIDLI